MKILRRCSVTRLFLATCLIASPGAFADCTNAAKVKLKLADRYISVWPNNYCLEVDDPGDPVSDQFEIDLPSVGNYPLADNQVRVVTTVIDADDEFPAKHTGDASNVCDPGITFSGTNTGNSDMVVTVSGNVTTTGVGCYDVIVGGLGRLDPRARVIPRYSALERGEQFARILDALDVLRETELAPVLELQSLDAFFQSGYGVSEAEARELADAYRASVGKAGR